MSALISPPAPAASPSPARITEEAFIARYAGTNAELVDGVVKEQPMPGWLHGMLSLRIGAMILAFVEEHDLGRVMSNDSWVRIRPGSFRGGDVLFVSYARLPKRDAVPEGVHTLAPDLVVEVKSPTDRWGELFTKVGEYLQAGVLVVAIVDPDTRTVSVHRDQGRQHILEEADALTLPDVLPGFSAPVARLFA